MRVFSFGFTLKNGAFCCLLRRGLLSAAMAVGVGAVLMLGCGGDDGDGGQNNSVVPGGGGGNNVIGNNGCTSGSACKQKTIGTQVWMTENLNIETADSWCYGNSVDSCRKYGRLYTWEAARTACPSGWHLPSREEWGTLAKYAGGTGDYGNGGTAGKALKSTSGWYNNGNGTDAHGFAALPGGGRYSGGSFYGVGGYGDWWTATEGSGGGAYRRNVDYNYGNLNEYDDDGDNGFSVRCVGD